MSEYMTEAEVLDMVRERRGDRFVEENRHRILDQARLVGELPPEG